MGMSLVHDVGVGSAASEARLWDDGIQALLETRDAYVRFAALVESEGHVEQGQRLRASADDLSAQAGVQQFRLLAFMLANRVTSGDLLAVSA